jgi:hypothetical protein
MTSKRKGYAGLLDNAEKEDVEKENVEKKRQRKLPYMDIFFFNTKRSREKEKIYTPYHHKTNHLSLIIVSTYPLLKIT